MTADAYPAIDQTLEQNSHDSDALHRNLYHLCDTIGPRFAGTEGYRRAAEYMLEQFQSYGLQQTQLEPFEIQAFRRDPDVTLTMTSPAEDKLACYELVYSAATGPDGVTANLLHLKNGLPEYFEKHEDNLAGQFVLITGGGRHRKEIYEDCVRYRAAGMIYTHNTPGMVLCSGSVGDGQPGAIPAVSIGREAGLKLARLAAAQTVTLHLKTQSFCERAMTWNVLGELPGTTHPDQFIIVGGHLDSHDIGPGAYDNAAGAVTVMEIARLLASQRQHLQRTIRFIGFAAEEVGLLGSEYHAEAHTHELDRARLMFNCDMPGCNPPWMIGSHRFDDFEAYLPTLNASMSESLTHRPITHNHSDHAPFTHRGVPGLVICGGRNEIKHPGFGHAAADTPEKLPTDGLAQGALISARILLRAANEPDWPGADGS